jgi:hypothetical protein
MELNGYAVNEETNELKLELTHQQQDYSVLFDFVERATGPLEHVMFPTGNKQLYAAPKEDIPDDLRLTPNSVAEEVEHKIEMSLPNGINLLRVPYEDVSEPEDTYSPFIG